MADFTNSSVNHSFGNASIEFRQAAQANSIVSGDRTAFLMADGMQNLVQALFLALREIRIIVGETAKMQEQSLQQSSSQGSTNLPHRLQR